MRGRFLGAAAILVAVGVVASIAVAAAPPRGWQLLAAGKAQGVFPLGYASGRVWFVIEDSSGNDSITSAHVGGSGLSSVVSTPMGQSPALPSSFVVGSGLVSLQGRSSVVASLLASGKLGASAPLPGDPEGTARDAFTPPNTSPDAWYAAAAVTVGGRTIWAVNGHSCPRSGSNQCTSNGGGYSSLVLCCTAAGEASDLTALLANRTKAGATDLAMGVDSHRRVWLAWLDGRQAHRPLGPGSLKLAQIDRGTLKAKSATLPASVFPSGPGGSGAFVLACTDACRLVYETVSGVYSWGGDGAPTQIWARNRLKDTGGHLIDASGGGSLRVASWSDKSANVPDDGQFLTTFRGDPRGRHPRVVSRVDIPRNLPAGGAHYFYPYSLPVPIYTPTALVALALYSGGPGGSSRLLDAVLHG